ncbi:unnamed protein product [Musa hybrid cultivar]
MNYENNLSIMVVLAACSTLWSEYEIIIEGESAFYMETSEDNSCATTLVPKYMKTDDTYQFLLDKFEADENKRYRRHHFKNECLNVPTKYCRDLMAKPLWPLPLSIGCPTIANIKKCNYCNGPLCYEFQIMPQLLYYFGVRNDPDSLDWGTIAVYSCLASCESSISCKEEFTWVQQYPSTPMT